MTRAATNDLDFLASRLHARRSRMAEAERLDALCRLRAVPELGQALYPDTAFPAAENFQRRLVQDLILELAGCRKHLDGAGQEFISGLLARYQVENMKTLLRGMENRVPLESVQAHLALLPADQALNAQALLAAGSVGEFAVRLPAGRPRDRLEKMPDLQRDEPSPFLLEAALDSGWHQEMLSRTARLPDEEQEIIRPLVFQEANLFQLMLVVRGKFHHGLAAEMLLPLRVSGSGVSGGWFKALLGATDLPAAAKCSLGIVLDELPAADDPGTVEALAWNRLRRLANGAFRRSHMGLGTVAGYAVLRRMEVANLITLSEGIRMNVDAGALRARLLPRTDLEVARV
jgi:vacuolar-type H+-ATPase subunit C/Vma6